MGFEEKLKVWVKKGAKASKSAFEKAGGAVQDFSDKSVLKLDKMKLESQKNKKFTELGIAVNDMIANGYTGFELETVPEGGFSEYAAAFRDLAGLCGVCGHDQLPG